MKNQRGYAATKAKKTLNRKEREGRKEESFYHEVCHELTLARRE